MIFFSATLILSFFSRIGSFEEFTQKIIIEDFEESSWSEKNIRVFSNSQAKPEVKISKTITSPNILSESSLLLRFPKETIDQNIEIKFLSPKEIDKYALFIRFQIFANGQGGELAFLIEDANFEVKRFSICNLNFSGWKEIQIPLGNKVSQRDRVLNQPAKIRFLGFLYTPALDKSINREDILAIDDIEAFVLEKYKLPKNFY